MRLYIILICDFALAFGQLQLPAPVGKAPVPYIPGQGYYPYPTTPNYPFNYQQYPYGYQGYPYNNNNNNYAPYYPVVPQFPTKGLVDPTPPIVPIPVVDIIQPGISGSVPLSPLEAALTQLDHRNKGHSEKYYYGRHGLTPDTEWAQPPRPLRPKTDPSRARSQYEYQGNTNYNLNYPGVGVDYPYYPQQYPQPQYQQYPYPQPQYPGYPQYPVTGGYPQYPGYPVYPYNTYYPTPSPLPLDNVNINLNPGPVAVGIPVDPYIGVKKPVVVDGEIVGVGNNNGGKKPFSVQKPEHYELYTYHR